jgi:hypothetical protein
MKIEGIKTTKVPHLFHVNYPKQSQIGFLVKIHRARGKKYEAFNFSQYPTKKACFSAAKKRAQDVDKLFPRLTRKEYAQIKRSNFKNSEVGVRKTIKKNKGFEYEFWEASWSPRVGAVKKKLFSVNKYGDEEARKLAQKARTEGLASMV